MNYTELLNDIIKKSGLRNVDILERLKEQGITTTSSYLSTLRNTPGRMGSPEFSMALGKVCNAPYDDMLVVQAELDKAGDTIKKYIEYATEQARRSGRTAAYFYPKSKQQELIDKVNALTDAYIICDLVHNIGDYDDKMQIVEDSLKTPIKFAMVPIAQGGEVMIVDKDGNKIE